MSSLFQCSQSDLRRSFWWNWTSCGVWRRKQKPPLIVWFQPVDFFSFHFLMQRCRHRHFFTSSSRLPFTPPEPAGFMMVRLIRSSSSSPHEHCIQASFRLPSTPGFQSWVSKRLCFSTLTLPPSGQFDILYNLRFKLHQLLMNLPLKILFFSQVEFVTIRKNSNSRELSLYPMLWELPAKPCRIQFSAVIYKFLLWGSGLFHHPLFF